MIFIRSVLEPRNQRKKYNFIRVFVLIPWYTFQCQYHWNPFESNWYFHFLEKGINKTKHNTLNYVGSGKFTTKYPKISIFTLNSVWFNVSKLLDNLCFINLEQIYALDCVVQLLTKPIIDTPGTRVSENKGQLRFHGNRRDQILVAPHWSVLPNTQPI